ncbi:MAG: TIGR03960 family B12-binding radical SAM protein [Thermodesulfobacteriota bacterium]|nr:TIGR03960 family B12-binding radical SAM protein [Thermodesulfobacteriota bacterium]
MTEIDQTEALLQVNRPTRYLGGELGSICKPAAGIDVRMVLAFPDVYEVGMSHIGFPILYNILNDLTWVAAERVYSPWEDMEQWLREQQQPLCSLESSLPLGEFDVIGFTLQYELSYTNLLTMLDLSGIPLRREQRDDNAPLIVVGGPCAFNPEPLADFFDVALIGDGEDAVVEFVELVRQAKQENWSRKQLLQKLAEGDGFYIPELFNVSYRDDGCIGEIAPILLGYDKVRRRFLNDLETAPFPTRPIVPFMQTVHNRIAMEIARGCTRGCRFCQAGYIYRPVRERSPETLRELIAAALQNSGYEEISLLSLSSGDYTCIEPLLQQLMAEHADDRISVSLPSLRVGSLTPELMEEVKKVRKTGFTLAPEAGSERLRELINKGIRTEELLDSTRNAFQLGWRLIKLYFMMGLPTETDDDLQALIELAAQVKKSGKGTGGNDVNVAVSTFVPKPHTPFQWEAQIGIDETLRKQRLLRDGLKQKRLRFKYHGAEASFLEGVFARGDRRLSVVLERAVELGCRFDGWWECFDFTKWQQAFADCDIDPTWYLRQRGEGEILPWEHIDCGVPKKFFLSERRKAFAGTATLDCRDGICHGCDICDFEELRMRLLNSAEQEVMNSATVAEKESLVEAGEQQTRVRLKLSKLGRARMVGHLEYLKMFQRAIRRAQLPIRYSQGFHPMPKVSYLEALPMGVSSETELVDLELLTHVPAEQVMKDINIQLPVGFKIVESKIIPWKSPSPSATVAASSYRVPLSQLLPAGLDERIEDFLGADQVLVSRIKKGVEKQVDIRRDVLKLILIDGELEIELIKGSPLQVAATLLEVGVEDIRRLGVKKTGIRLKEQGTRVETLNLAP